MNTCIFGVLVTLKSRAYKCAETKESKIKDIPPRVISKNSIKPRQNVTSRYFYDDHMTVT